MNRARTAAIAALVVVPLLAGCEVVKQGHVDAVSVRPRGASLEVMGKNSIGGTVQWQPVDEFVYVVDSDAVATVPNNPEYSFLGTAGSQVWILPQVQDNELPWIGWNTEEIPASFVAQNRVRWRLLSVAGAGDVTIFTNDPLGGADVIFNSRDGLPDSVNVSVGTHAHGNWSFSEPGGYAVRYEISATLAAGGTFRREFYVWFAVLEDDV